ncbi:sel1 repeat family protein [Lichenihabitans sp. PAMC28606]|uniref:tetratricopeptide repeat protein n=1 Tax=Lichenihabitans sp. PAMC28606 TaxID=2880932 RepID=UPI001D0B0F22|nr:tetratricopeptide repeat protein [Lichenihabitans sp. PAMC28606]UDL95459.1 sel1 repeat family protein [Lichenihabitans sp. PAMC28606]
MLAASRFSLVLMAGCFIAVGTSASALDGNDYAPANKGSLQVFKNPQQALRVGVDGYRSGDVKSSVEAFKYAAANGNPLARWKLGKMYADGDGVPHDDAKAFDYFSQIVQNYDEDDDNRRDMSVVSNAFVALGVYSLNGIANSPVKPNPERALEMFQYAALTFGNADAQYNLARLFLDGADGIPKDIRQAARWLSLAAEKNHYQAEALLGHMLFNGFDGFAQQRAKGLMWLTLARDAALDSKDPKDGWIVDLYNKAADTATDNDRQVAMVYAEERRKRN